MRLHELCCRTLFRSGDDPYTWRWQDAGHGQQRFRPLRITAKYFGSPADYTFLATKRRLSIPTNEHSYLKQRALNLHYFAQKHWRLHFGTITLDRRCGLEEAVKRSREALKRLTRFFAKVRDSYDVELLFGVVQDSMRNPDWSLCRGSTGELLHHIHVHFLMRFNVPKRKRQRWNKRFRDAFGAGSEIEAAHDVHDVVEYITRRSDFAALLKAGEYVKWSGLMEGVRRSAFAGSFKWRMRRIEANDIKVKRSIGKNGKYRYTLKQVAKKAKSQNGRRSSGTKVVAANTVIAKQGCETEGEEKQIRTLVLNYQKLRSEEQHPKWFPLSTSNPPPFERT